MKPIFHIAGLVALLFLGPGPARGDGRGALAGLGALYPALDSLYLDLHRTPELSFHEEKTAAKMAARLRSLGFDVTAHVGGFGVVAVMRNGAGPTVLIRTDMDALPVQEQTGLPYASTVTVKDDAGGTVSIMHACGHDIHMTAWIGAATLLSRSRNTWQGTLVFVGQPAEEVTQGAARMLKDGFLKRFPRPDVALALHDTHALPAGQVGFVSGPAYAASNAVDVTFFGKGGHGAFPHLTIDPLLIAARAVVTLQAIVSREVNPIQPAVVTVGTFHSGTKRNIIPDDAKIELTVRSFDSGVQKQLLAAISRIAKAEAAAGGAPREPLVVVDSLQSSEVVVNDPATIARLVPALRKGLGEANVVSTGPVTVSEDFGEFGRTAGIPSVMLWIGAIEPGEFARAKAEGRVVPALHSSRFAPDHEPTIRTAVSALTLSALELLSGPGRKR